MAKPEPSRKARLVVRTLSGTSARGRLHLGSFSVPCAIGKNGIRALKREGDGASPRGAFLLREVLYNAARSPRPTTLLNATRIRKGDGWCDCPRDRNYNRKVSRPYRARSEALFRDDGLYDIVVVLGYNDVPRVRNRGSAIFMHIARPDFAPTEGCVALRRADLLRLLSRLPRHAEIVIG
jgi:L,D-peptidoglycan transpeptidase YkuD (ErfK/YbiS/YcfS/YnhG family)